VTLLQSLDHAQLVELVFILLLAVALIPRRGDDV